MADKELTQGFIRNRFRDLEPTSVDEDNKAYAQYISAAPVTPLGHNSQIVSTAAVPLPGIPANCKRVYMTAEGQPIRFRDDGVAPTSTSGYPIPASTHFTYDTEPTTNFKMILDSTATGDVLVSIAYYG